MICEACENSLISIRKNHLECLKCHMEIGKENLKYWEIIEKMPNYAAKHDKPEIIKYLYEEGYYFDKNIFMDAYKNRSKRSIDYLLENNVKGCKKFLKYYSNEKEIYDEINNILKKRLNYDTKNLILSKLYCIKEGKLFKVKIN